MAPEDILNDFSFIMAGTSGSFPIVGQVYAWQGGNPVGMPLYTTAVINLAFSSEFQSYDFNVHDLPVVAGQEYVAVVTNDPNGVSLGGWGYGEAMLSDVPSLPGRDASASGFTFTGGNPTTGVWCVDGCYENASFTANFSTDFPVSAIPEPSSLVILTGLLGIGLRIRRQPRPSPERDFA